MLEENSQWLVGSETHGSSIWFEIKGEISSKFSHHFISIDDAELFAKNVLEITKKLKEKSVGKCPCCKNYITNGNEYYAIKEEIKVHKSCIGDYLETDIVNKVLIPMKADEFDINKFKIIHLKN